MVYERNVKEYCCEDISKIENYDKAVADTTQTWECHHRMELIETGAIVDSSRQDLIDWGIYYNRSADELIFLTHSEHQRLHTKGLKGKGPFKGRSHSEETKRKITEKLKSKPTKSMKSAVAYREYKANGGEMKWNEFQKQRKVS